MKIIYLWNYPGLKSITGREKVKEVSDGKREWEQEE
jgi:hypothetical protein